MSSDQPYRSLPRVVAVLVVTDGEDWLPAVLGTVAGQTYPNLDLVVVDNASRDGSPEILARRIPQDRLVTLPRRTGFGRAAAAALRLVEPEDDDLVLFLHDDLALGPDALARLVVTLSEKPEVAIVGPKLREWDVEPLLAEVGMTVDRLGRAETLLDRGELDQGQHDQRAEVLYVSTAGMLVRAGVLRQLRGLDPRFPLMRDDLDFCWRAWLTGHRVEVVPEAVGYHLAASTRQERPAGRGRTWQAHYLAERHAAATLIKNYGIVHLLWVLPVLLILTGGEVVAFLVTRRFGEAHATLRAYGWNLLQLPRTLQARRAVQQTRQRSDRELAHLFARGLPRVREYVEAIGSWVAGGGTRALIEDADDVRGAGEGQGNAVVRLVRQYPVALSGGGLLAVYALGLLPWLGGGQIVGGEILPWPEDPRTFLSAYASAWNGDPAGTSAFPSPIQAVLGLASFLGFGSAWLAQRLLVFGLVPVTWLVAVRTGRLLTARPWPRVLGATLYVLSPVVLGALAQGRYGTLVVASLLPGLVLVGARAADATASPAGAWRAAAWLLLGIVVAVAALLPFAVVIVPFVLILGALSLRRRPGRAQTVARLGIAVGGAALLLAPWLVGLARHPTVFATPVAPVSLPAWRALAVAPVTLPGLDGLAGVAAAATTAAVVVAAGLLAWHLRPGVVTGLLGVVVASALSAWGASRLGVQWVWIPALLLPAALAVAGLGVITARDLAQGLAGYDFGVRQLGVVAAVGVLAFGLTTSVVRLSSGPWAELTRSSQLAPLFVGADAERVGPYRVLLLRATEAELLWEIAPAEGPSMVSFGTVHSRALLDYVDAQVAGMVGNDPGAGAALGAANVRYVIVQDTSDRRQLTDRLREQSALEPLTSAGGRVFKVRTWLPRAVVLPPAPSRRLVESGAIGFVAGVEEQGFARLGPGLYRGIAPSDPGMLVLIEEQSPVWRGIAEGRPLQRVPVSDSRLPVNAFRVPDGALLVQAVAAGGIVHAGLVSFQILVVFAALSLALRPPRFAESPRRRATALPTFLRPGPSRTDEGGDGAASQVGADAGAGGAPPPS